MAAKRLKADSPTDNVVIIKKYANRRLYNTSSSSYVTLDDLRKMVQQDLDFRVVDAKTNEDLTRAVLTQIIVEEESRGQNLLPISFLRQIITMYEDSMRWTLPQYLETVMGWYGRNQQELQKQFSQSIGGMLPPGVEDLQRRQLALLDRTMRMFNPLAGKAEDVTPPRTAESASTEGENPESKAEIKGLRDQIAALQEAVENLARRNG
jgi:polyhydroxyalkanoate synthesis repressor PhaR